MDTFKVRLTTMRRRIFAWARALEAWRDSGGRFRVAMVTLTYDDPAAWRSDQLEAYLQWLRQKYRRSKRLLGFAWVAEIQADRYRRTGQAVVHYHILLVLKPGTLLPKPDKTCYWKYGMSRVETAKTLYYICAYVGKEKQKDLALFPKSCRTYGLSLLRVPAEFRDVYRDQMASTSVTMRQLVIEEIPSATLVPGAEVDRQDWKFVRALSSDFLIDKELEE